MTSDETTTKLLRNLHMLRRIVGDVLESGVLREAGETRVTFTQINLLKLLGSKRQRPWSIGDVAEVQEISFPAASKAISRLERDGWVTVTLDPDDARARCIELTVKAKRLIGRFDRYEHQRARAIVEQEARAKSRRWNDALEEIIGSILAAAPDDARPCLGCGVHDAGNCIAEEFGSHCPVHGNQ